eukprot:CAMPEP_0183346128 /NCGR_PEP_ID=MMETSP0164_2-20130417/11339_1 /TAXON_ID=221442 /ORGANISM="Coccolithus pelagicus ssp braarudi, Strain PLY182g" /LENGTH=180 /DNA_ID=CAMNT_0025517353 /DNA_START=240 /DNA_END=782 /DNA_ORIENTATION=+
MTTLLKRISFASRPSNHMDRHLHALTWPTSMPGIASWGSAVATRRMLSSAFETNIGYARLAFNVGAEDHMALRCRVFDTPTGRAFLASCPLTIERLSTFGDEVYGALAVTLPPTAPQSYVPPGGLAYSERGQFLCVFYGQTPAWPVTYFAQIEVGHEVMQGGSWRELTVAMEDPLAMESY